MKDRRSAVKGTASVPARLARALRRADGSLVRALLLCAMPTLASLAGAAEARTLRIVALGDSLTAGYGLPAGNAFPAVLEGALRARGYDVAVVNAGVSGDTASGGYARLEANVPGGTDGVILEFGGNDMLRNVDLGQTRGALAAIVARLRQRGIPVLLVGVKALPDKPRAYAGAFDAIYPGLARTYGLSYYPSFLRGVFGVPGLMLPDGIHPTAAGVQRVVGAMLPTVERFLGRLRTR